MKTKTIITDITKEDLVDLFSTAFYGSQYWGVDYDKNEFYKLPNIDDCECLEDRLANMLLNGKPITIYDMYAEDDDDFYGDLWHQWDEENETMDYTVTLADIKRGLQKCLDGTFEVNDGCDNEIDYMKVCMKDYMTDDCSNLDLPEAESIMQVIVFGQIIYG